MKTEYIKKWINSTKEKLLKCMGDKCAVCQYDACKSALDFHHLDPSKKDFTLSTWKVKNWKKIIEEAKKCIILCARCHRELHAGYINLNNVKIVFDEDLCKQFTENPGYTKKVKWDEVDIVGLLKNNSVKEICVLLNISETVLYKKMRELKIQKNKENISMDKEKIQNLINDMPMVHVAKMFGITDNSLRKRCKKLGIILPKKGRGYWSKSLHLTKGKDNI
jgi:hypothetical protein